MNKKLGPEGEKLIKDFELLRFEAYMPTPFDRPTIAWGHTLDVKMGDVVDTVRAQEMFIEDTADAINCVNRNVTTELTQTEFDALVSLCFNIGCYNFKSSTLVRKLNNDDFEGAAKEFAKWNKQRMDGKLVVLNGLTKRREAERKLFTGESYA